ncbi:SIS domain-containing protein [Paenibacillus hodogayensis]|uniref:SIS domain-containing protein n=1 Tax=Paenibacillus hodogayensis TaxID=279208 RepID=A0ABV5W8L1_9BACL
MYQSYIEIFEQYDSLKQTSEYVQAQRESISQLFESEKPQEIVFVACGSSYWGSLSASVTMEHKLGVRCYTVASGDVLLNQDYYKKRFTKPLIIAPSRSGSTSETIQAVTLLKESYHSSVLSIVEYENSPLAQISDLCLYIPWCNEASVCQTRSFVSLYMTQLFLTSIWSHDHSLIEEADRYIQNASMIIRANEDRLKRIAEQPWDHVVALGNGSLFGVACEGALIMLEMAQIPVSFYNTLELRHGPIVNVNAKTLVVLFSSGNSTEGQRLEEDLAQDCRNKGAEVIAIGKAGTFQQLNELFSLEQQSHTELTAFLGSFVAQGVAYYKAIQKGVNPDSPQGLNPWIQIGTP